MLRQAHLHNRMDKTVRRNFFIMPQNARDDTRRDVHSLRRDSFNMETDHMQPLTAHKLNNFLLQLDRYGSHALPIHVHKLAYLVGQNIAKLSHIIPFRIRIVLLVVHLSPLISFGHYRVCLRYPFLFFFLASFLPLCYVG